jgi:hypothetical protein
MVKPPAARETAVTRRIMDALRARGHLVRKLHGTVWSTVGDPDLYGARSPDGRAFAVEIKRPGEKPTEIQLKRIEEWGKSGAAAGWATSPEEAIAIVEEARDEP